jgi:Flp pilus assembly protein TadG
MRYLKLARNERGVTLALMAVTIFLTLAMAAIAIDYGMIKSAKAEGQRAMDAAALAGASALLISDPSVNLDTEAKLRAQDYALKHSVRNVPIDTAAELGVTVDLVANTVKADWHRAAIGLWFGRMFGSGTMGLSASATAHVEETSTATCVKPVAIPDIWDNKPHIVGGVEVEDKNGDHLWDYVDGTGRGSSGGTVGQWDEGEGEPWTFDPSLGDTYNNGTTGYGTGFRNNYGSGSTAKTNDYGRQIMLTTFSPKDSDVQSMYYSWGSDTSQTNADSVAAAIRGARCQPAATATSYSAANGGKIGPIQVAWGDLIATDPSATWVDGAGGGTVTGSLYGADWQTDSPRAIVVALYDPSIYAGSPNANTLQFVNFAKVWVDQRPCSGAPGTCKAPITARFLGYVNGGGATGEPVGTLVKHLVLIK